MSKRQRKTVDIEYEINDEDEVGKMKKITKFSPPDNWKTLYETLKTFRYITLPPAPVDTMGCDMLHVKDASEKDRRFQILISLLLSSQTKDPVTAEAMGKLHELGNNKSGSTCGITISSVLSCTDQEVNTCIAKVGFHRKKTVFIRKVAEICRNDFEGDIPQTIEDLLALPGIGPKMGYLALQAAWGKNEGIGVDTHVHRIATRLKWVPRGTEEKGPEATRKALESWLPKELWGEINHLLVGLGQTVCLPRNPLCSECAAKDLCPSSSAKTKRKK